MSLLEQLASSFDLVNGAQQLWRSSLLPSLAAMRTEEVAVDTTIIVVDDIDGMVVGSLKVHSLLLAAASSLLSEMLLSSWPGGNSDFFVTLVGRDLVEVEQVVEGLYKGEEGWVSRLISWIQGSDNQEDFDFKREVNDFMRLEQEILSDIIGNAGDAEKENIKTKGKEEALVTKYGTSHDQAIFPKKRVPTHLKYAGRTNNENHVDFKTNAGVGNFSERKGESLQDMFQPVDNCEEVVKDDQKHCSPLNEVQTPTTQILSCPELGCRRSFGHRQGLRAHIKNVHRKSLQGTSD